MIGKSRQEEQTWPDHREKKSIASLESLMRYKGSAYKLVILPMKKFPSVISLNLRGFLVDFQLAFTIRIHRANRKMF